MARCNCAGNSCNCLIIAGAGTTVTGTGTAADPYVVSVGAISITGRFGVTDSASIDMTLLGSGTVGDPYLISGVVSTGTLAEMNRQAERAEVAAAAAAAAATVRQVAPVEANIANGTGVWWMPSNVQLRFTARGSDGVVRVANIPLA